MEKPHPSLSQPEEFPDYVGACVELAIVAGEATRDSDGNLQATSLSTKTETASQETPSSEIFPDYVGAMAALAEVVGEVPAQRKLPRLGTIFQRIQGGRK